MYQVLLFKFRRHLCKGSISMEEPIFSLDSLNINDLPRHFISMQERIFFPKL